MKSVASAPGAHAAILDWVRVDDDTDSWSSEYFRIKIFSEEGKKYADIELPYVPGYPFYGRITNVDARTVRPDGTVVPFDGKIYDKILVKVGRRAVKAKTFTLPDVQPGSIIEYRYTRRWSEQMLLNTTWNVQHELPLLRAKLTLKPYQSSGDFSSFFTYVGLPQGKSPVKVQDRFELELENMPAFVEESYAPPERILKANVNFYYTSSRVKPSEFWDVEPKNIAKRVDDFLNRAGAAKTAVATLTGPDPAATAKKIYAHVQGFRNYSFELEKTEQEMKKDPIIAAKVVNDVITRKAGSSEDLNRAFVALARAAGLQADVVRVAPRDTTFFSKNLPDADQMSAEVAVVTIDGKDVYLDPGTPHAPFGTVSWEKSNVPGLRIVKGQPPQWVNTPQPPPDASTIRRVADLKIEDENLTGRIVITYNGQDALVRRLRVLPDDEADRTKDFEEEAKRWFADGATVKLASLTGMTSFDEPLVATFDVTLPNMVSAAGSRTIVPLSVFFANRANPFAATERTHAIYFEYPRTDLDEVKLTIPDTLKISGVPTPSNHDAGALAYKTEVKRDGQTVTFKRRMSVSAMLIDQQNYGALRKFYSHLRTLDQEPVVLVASE